MPRGRAAEPLVRLIDCGQQLDVRRGVVALVARPPGGLDGDPPDANIAANQPRGLRPAEPSHALDVGPQRPFRTPPLKRVLVMAVQALYPAVNLRAAASYKPHTLRGSKKCLDLNQTQLLCSKHADHPSSACPLRLLQAHLALESTPPLRLILRWTRVAVRFCGDSTMIAGGKVKNENPGQNRTLGVRARSMSKARLPKWSARSLTTCVIVLLCGCGGGNSSSAVSVSVTVTPSSAAIKLSSQQQFSASISGTSNVSVVWDVNGVPGGSTAAGTITSAGLYEL